MHDDTKSKFLVKIVIVTLIEIGIRDIDCSSDLGGPGRHAVKIVVFVWLWCVWSVECDDNAAMGDSVAVLCVVTVVAWSCTEVRASAVAVDSLP